MALVLKDRVKETTAVVGTGTATLLGAATGFQAFSAVGDGNTTYYVIAGTTEWEVGIGTYTASGTTLSRDTVLASSNAGALVNFSAGTKDAWVDYAAGKAVTTDTLAYPPAIGGTTPAAGTFTTLTATGQTSLGGAAGSEGLRVNSVASSVNYLQVDGSTTSNWVTARFTGSDSNVTGALVSRGSGSLIFATNNSSGNNQMRVTHTASAVNYVQVTGAATGSAPTISAQGSDTNSTLAIASKGTGAIRFDTGGATAQFRVLNTASAVNRIDVTGSATGFGVVTTVSGTDTNISQVFQSKGTGAIDLAAGSSGVNISNGGTVTAVTRTAAGSGYTTIPSVAVSAPTTAGGVQATASIAQMQIAGAAIQSGGTGYTVGDTLTIVGGTVVTSAATLTVATVSAGVITSVNIGSFTNYTTLPTNPVSVTGGTGSGATFNLTWAVISFTITNAGSGYVEQPTVSFSGGGGSGAAATAYVGTTPIIKTVFSSMALQTPSANMVFQVQDDTSIGASASTLYAIGASSGLGRVAFRSSKALYIGSGSSNPLGFYTNTSQTAEGSQQFAITHTASAVNYVQVTGAATGNNPVISVQGSDANRALTFNSKGTGFFNFLSQNGANFQFRVDSSAVAVNHLVVAGSVASSAPVLSAQGSDTNIDLTLTPKGTGQTKSKVFNATNGIIANAQTVSADYTIASGDNAMSAGPVSVASGITVTVSTGSVWTVI